MPIRVNCSACDAGYTLADIHGGRSIRCQKCQAILPVPTIAESAIPRVAGRGVGKTAVHRKSRPLLREKTLAIKPLSVFTTELPACRLAG